MAAIPASTSSQPATQSTPAASTTIPDINESASADNSDWRQRPQDTSLASEVLSVVPSLRILVGLLIGTLVICALFFGRNLLLPLALAILFSFLLDPLVSRVQHWGLPRMPSVMLVLIVVLGLLGGASVFLGSQVRDLSADLPTYQNTIRDKLRNLRSMTSGPGVLDGIVKTYDTFQNEIGGSSAPPATQTVPPAPANKTTSSTGTHGGKTATKKEAIATSTSDSAEATDTPAAAPSTAQVMQVEEKPRSPFQQAGDWLIKIIEPVATAGIVLIFVVLILLDRNDLRERMLRLMGGNLHRSTDALNEASTRISKYLTMQLIVNVTYGIPMAIGLWFIGVPGAILWGVLAAVMRFVPYVGPMITAVFPLVLAFAVDPGWNMILWTAGLIIVLELISNNVVEPWLYGSSTGLSTISLILAATFWTAIWGPVGLILSTPLTVCLLVMGRNLKQLKFLDVLLGSEPVLDTPTRLYERLLAGGVEEAIELANDCIDDKKEEQSTTEFYNSAGIPFLRLASIDHNVAATPEHRLRIVNGTNELIEDLREQYPVDEAPHPQVMCIGARWEIDTLGANMLAHAISLHGHSADYLRMSPSISTEAMAQLDLHDAPVVCISYFTAEPQAHVRLITRRLRRRWPQLRIVLALWSAPPDMLTPEAMGKLGVDGVTTSLRECVLAVSALLQKGQQTSESYTAAAPPPNDKERLLALQNSGLLDPQRQESLTRVARRAADIFDVSMCMVTTVDDRWMIAQGASGDVRIPEGEEDLPGIERELSMCGHVVADGETLVVPDLNRDPRFASNPAMTGRNIRFYAGAPLRDKQGHVLGTLCLIDDVPRSLTEREVRLLEAMAKDVVKSLDEPVSTQQPV